MTAATTGIITNRISVSRQLVCNRNTIIASIDRPLRMTAVIADEDADAICCASCVSREMSTPADWSS